MKERLDTLLVKDGYFEDIEKAKRAIMAGIVIVNDKKVDKPGTIINLKKEYSLRVKGEKLKFVSRGGLKLEKAIKEFGLDFQNKVVLDVGASTGGFTDCSLQSGATKVYAVDVGTNQLDWKLRNDDRVISIENTHINDLEKDTIKEKIDYIVVDVSFISILKIIDELIKFFSENTKLMILIKPQFEAEKTQIEKGGIVTNSQYHIEIIKRVIEEINKKGLYLENLSFSPITGAKGNIEYLSLFGLSKVQNNINIEDIVKTGESLGGKI